MAAAKHGFRRRQWLVNRPMQFAFARAVLGGFALFMGLTLAAICAALWMTVSMFQLQHDPVTMALFRTVAWVVVLELLLITPLVVWFGIRLTHTVAGPLVRIQAALAQMTAGRFDVRLVLRRGDHLQELADAVNGLAASLRSPKGKT
jgi:methyl-accepting chemotaxis protein